MDFKKGRTPTADLSLVPLAVCCCNFSGSVEYERFAPVQDEVEAVHRELRLFGCRLDHVRIVAPKTNDRSAA